MTARAVVGRGEKKSLLCDPGFLVTFRNGEGEMKSAKMTTRDEQKKISVRNQLLRAPCSADRRCEYSMRVGEGRNKGCEYSRDDSEGRVP